MCALVDAIFAVVGGVSCVSSVSTGGQRVEAQRQAGLRVTSAFIPRLPRLGLGRGAGSNKTYGLAKDGVGVSSGGVDEFDEPPKKSTEKKKKKKKKAEEGGDDWMRTTNIMQVHDHGGF